MLRWLIPLLLISLLEFYSFQAVKTVIKSKWVLGIYLLLSLSVIVYITYFFLTHDRGSGQNKQSLFTVGLFLITFLPKIFITVILLGEDIYRLLAGCLNYFIGNNNSDYFFPQRRKFVSQIALSIAAIPFGSLLYGMTIGKYNFKVRKKTLYFSE